VPGASVLLLSSSLGMTKGRALTFGCSGRGKVIRPVTLPDFLLLSGKQIKGKQASKICKSPPIDERPEALEIQQ
jgi:hypothetical protein